MNALYSIFLALFDPGDEMKSVFVGGCKFPFRSRAPRLLRSAVRKQISRKR